MIEKSNITKGRRLKMIIGLEKCYTCNNYIQDQDPTVSFCTSATCCKNNGFPEYVPKETPEHMEETIRSASDIITGMQLDVLRSLAMPLRLRFINNITSRIVNNHPDGDSTKLIDWDMVNTILHFPIADDDYNDVPKQLSSRADIVDAEERCIMATANLSPWRMETCSQCHQEFYIFYGEMDYYKRNNLHLPKRCKKCRDLRKHKTSQV